jgi:hypothetical protein
MPGGAIQRHPCSNVASQDRSLLAPEAQPQFASRGPLNVFGPYSNDHGSFDQARSRSTAAHYRAANGDDFLFVTGSSKRSTLSGVSIPPGIAKLEIVKSARDAAYLCTSVLESTQTFQNPGSPIVSSDGSDSAIVWVLDANAPRTAVLYGPHAPQPVLYAFDAQYLHPLWKSDPGVLFPSGKYNEPTVVNGKVYVGTDRLQVFGRLSPTPQPIAHTGDRIAEGAYTDFELHLEYRSRSPGASGRLVFRSDGLSDAASRHFYETTLVSNTPIDLFAIRRSDVTEVPLALSGESADFHLLNGRPHPQILNLVNDAQQIHDGLKPYPAWNDYVLRVSGNRISQAVNGLLVNDVTDNDFDGRLLRGAIRLLTDPKEEDAIEVRKVYISEPVLTDSLTRRFTTHIQPSPVALTEQQRVASAAGQALFQQRCFPCHGNSQSGAPPVESLAQFPEGRITDILTDGLMRDMAAGISDEGKRSIAVYLTSGMAERP